MNREALAAVGIQLPVLPTIVLGGLPGPPDWAALLARIGLDVISSGADPDTTETLAAAAAAVPFRPLKAVGDAPAPAGRPALRELGGAGWDRIEPDEVVVVVHGGRPLEDPNDVARELLSAAAEAPSRWWVAAADLAHARDDLAEAKLAALVAGVQLVRLYLAKQQFD